MKASLWLCGWILAGLPLLTACAAKTSIVSFNPPQAVPKVEPLVETSAPGLTPLPDNVQIYRDKDEMFALALPTGYTHEAGDRTVRFTSADQGFGGEVDYAAAEASLTPEQLEARLQQALQQRYVDVTFAEGGAEAQEDGSLRLSWQGTNSDGAQLDALSFIEQHGNTVYILTAHGIDRPYVAYNQDARVIAGSYVVREETPAIADMQ
ncbi:MAG: hypothetical protein AAF289_16250 [Cyanobacteria bacterium P01_A01_bin.135]